MALTNNLSERIIYPERDGSPVGESDGHIDAMLELRYTLKRLLRTRVAYVTSNLFIYYVEGHPEQVVCPDVSVIFGVPQQQRGVYKAWEYGGKLPDLVIELTSPETRLRDLGEKRILYASFGVQEYYLFDPMQEYLVPPLRGYELVDGELQPLPGPRLISKLLGLELRVIQGRLRLADPASGAIVPAPYDYEAELQHEAQARAQAEAELQQQAQARAQAEAELARLRAELRHLHEQQTNEENGEA